MPQIGNVEYEPVVVQAAGRAVCAWDNEWYSRSTQVRIDLEPTPYRYVRSRQTAITVRVRLPGTGGGYRPPTADELALALNHATTN